MVLVLSCGCSSCSLCALSRYQNYVLTTPASRPRRAFALPAVDWDNLTSSFGPPQSGDDFLRRPRHRVVATMALAPVLVVALVSSSVSPCDALVDCADCAVSAAVESGGLMGRVPTLHPNSVQYTLPSSPAVSARELCSDASYEPEPYILGEPYLLWCARPPPQTVSSTSAKCDGVKRSIPTHLY